MKKSTQYYYASFNPKLNVTKHFNGSLLFSIHALYVEGYPRTSLSPHLRNFQSIFLYIYSVRCVELLTFLSVYDGNEYQIKENAVYFGF